MPRATLTCRSCGADLHERTQEVCMTLTAQPLRVPDVCPPGMSCVSWDDSEIFYECQERCYYECRDCLTTLTPRQDALLTALL